MSPRARQTMWPFPSRSHQLLLPTHEALPQSLQINTQIPVFLPIPGPARCFSRKPSKVLQSQQFFYCPRAICKHLPKPLLPLCLLSASCHTRATRLQKRLDLKCMKTNTEGQSPADEVPVLILEVRDSAQPGHKEKSMFSGEG